MAQMTQRAVNQGARDRLVDIRVAMEEIEDFIQAFCTLDNSMCFYKPAVALVDGIGERIDRIHQAVMANGTAIYDELEETRLRDVEVKK
jgi:hypothetical protein